MGLLGDIVHGVIESFGGGDEKFDFGGRDDPGGKTERTDSVVIERLDRTQADGTPRVTFRPADSRDRNANSTKGRVVGETLVVVSATSLEKDRSLSATAQRTNVWAARSQGFTTVELYLDTDGRDFPREIANSNFGRRIVVPCKTVAEMGERMIDLMGGEQLGHGIRAVPPVAAVAVSGVSGSAEVVNRVEFAEYCTGRKVRLIGSMVNYDEQAELRGKKLSIPEGQIHPTERMNVPDVATALRYDAITGPESHHLTSRVAEAIYLHTAHFSNYRMLPEGVDTTDLTPERAYEIAETRVVRVSDDLPFGPMVDAMATPKPPHRYSEKERVILASYGSRVVQAFGLGKSIEFLPEPEVSRTAENLGATPGEIGRSSSYDGPTADDGFAR